MFPYYGPAKAYFSTHPLPEREMLYISSEGEVAHPIPHSNKPKQDVLSFSKYLGMSRPSKGLSHRIHSKFNRVNAFAQHPFGRVLSTTAVLFHQSTL